MPRRTVRRVGRLTTVDMDAVRTLVHGVPFQKPDFETWPESARPTWEELQGELFEFYAEHFPGHRPWVWWHFGDHRRLQTAGAAPTFAISLWRYGLPAFAPAPESMQRLIDLADVPGYASQAVQARFWLAARWESTAAFLRRTGALLDGETSDGLEDGPASELQAAESCLDTKPLLELYR